MTGVGLCLAAVLVILSCLLWSYTLPQPATDFDSAHTDNSSVQQSSLPRPSLKQFEVLWQKPLRRPLVDPPPSTTVDRPAPVRKRSLPRIRLLGIALESGHSLAIFATPQGAIEVKGVGETLGDTPNGPQVFAIEARQVMLRYQGDTVTMTLKEEKGG